MGVNANVRNFLRCRKKAENTVQIFYSCVCNVFIYVCAKNGGKTRTGSRNSLSSHNSGGFS
ncbi:hypothetical protein HanRHA438_Chr01g0041241 [Helianthus annuus]|nr:hypothetical protein HanRHA438_Chr01g0041241 [Helianthus annuus]